MSSDVQIVIWRWKVSDTLNDIKDPSKDLSVTLITHVGNMDDPLSESGLDSESEKYKGNYTTSSDILEASTPSEYIVLRASNGMSTDMPIKNECSQWD